MSTAPNKRRYKMLVFIGASIVTIGALAVNLTGVGPSGFGLFAAFAGVVSPAFLSALKSWEEVGADQDRRKSHAATWNNPTANTGFTSAAHPSILVIPRYPSNLFYNLSTPEEWVSEYNCFYGPTGKCAGGAWKFWDHDLSYAEILDKESAFLVSYLLKWNINPLMFHQPNLRAYDGTHSLLTDLIDATMAKYNAMYNLPIVNLTEHNVGLNMTEWMGYRESGVTGSLVPCVGTAPATLTITSPRAATIPVTGVSVAGRSATRETYGGQDISYVRLAAGKSTTIPLTRCP